MYRKVYTCTKMIANPSQGSIVGISTFKIRRMEILQSFTKEKAHLQKMEIWQLLGMFKECSIGSEGVSYLSEQWCLVRVKGLDAYQGC